MISTVEPLRVLTIPGDGIGREVVPAAVAVLRATGLPLAFDEAEAGWVCFQEHGTSLPDATLEAARSADAVLFGAVGSPSFPMAGYRSPIVALRRTLGLYANIRPVQNQEPRTKNQESNEHGSRSSVLGSSPIDLVVVRENTEGLYAGRERVEDGGATAIAERVITRAASERIVRAAFELARVRGSGIRDQGSGASTGDGETHSPTPDPRPLVTIVHKANVLRETCGLFRTTALEVAAEYPDVAHDELLVDNCALQLVQHPERFDVIVTTNLFGDILSDVASYWGGGLGLAVSANLGEGRALFEPVHGSAPDIAGRGIANPLAAIGCAALLLEWLAEHKARDDRERAALLEHTNRIRAAVAQVQANGPRTPDMGGEAETEDVTRAIIGALG